MDIIVNPRALPPKFLHRDILFRSNAVQKFGQGAQETNDD